MKNLYRISVINILVTLVMSCIKPAPPDVITIDVSNISYKFATSGGIVTNERGSAVTSRGVRWYTSDEPDFSNILVDDSIGTGSFKCVLHSLIPNTTYIIRAFATNSEGTGYGSRITFTTSAIEIPVLTTKEVTKITQNTAESGVSITDIKGEASTSSGVCWATVPNPTIQDSKTTDGGKLKGVGTYKCSINELTANTYYYIRAYSTNSAGTGYGNQLSFTTLPAEVPVITTTEISAVSRTTALSGGNVTDDRGGWVMARGICWATSEYPTTTDDKTLDGSGIGSFKSSMEGLIPNTKYFVRAYATNNAGTGYGNLISFITDPLEGIAFNPDLSYGTTTDIEDNVYKIITIGTQVWMAENLKTSRYNNGDLIGTTTPATFDYSDENSPEYQWAYNGDDSNVAIYGRLYTWDVIIDSRNVCPTGWHVPSYTEWTTLFTYLQGGNVGGKLKETGTNHWKSPNPGTTNESGFTALPGGYHSSIGGFNSLEVIGTWWSTTEFDHDNPIVVTISYIDGYSVMGIYGKCGRSVRCVRDY